MKKLTVCKLVCISLLCLVSCETTVPEPIEVVSVDQEFEVFPTQKLSLEGSVLYLTVRSSEPDSCINAILDADYQMLDNTITLELNGIMYPEMCQEGQEYIQKEFPLPSATAEYSIEFIKNGFNSTSGKIIVTNEYIELDIDSLGGVFVLESNLSLVKENYAWGYFAERNGVSPGSNFNLDEVVSEMASLGRGFNPIPEGNYAYFSIADDGSVSIPDLKEGAQALAFDVATEDGWDKLKTALDYLGSNNNELFFQFTNWRGENHHN